MLLLGLVLLIVQSPNFAQDSSRMDKGYPKIGYVTSGILTGAGIMTHNETTRNGFRDFIRNSVSVKRTNIDDIMQHAPLLILMGSDLINQPGKAEVGRQLRHFLVAQTSSMLTVYTLKFLTKTVRPNGGPRSFPSGHTAWVFGNAQLLYHSLKKTHPFWAYVGYVPAIFTGTYRILKDKHWISDVLAGAGIGILSSHFTYHLNIWQARTGSEKGQSDIPVRLNFGTGAVGLTVQF